MNEHLRKAMERRKITEMALAVKTGVTVRTIQYCRNGRTPTLPVAINIAEAIEGRPVDTTYLKYLFDLDIA